MPDSNNGNRVLDMIQRSLGKLDEKMDRVIECTARNDERLDMHGRLFKWIFGLIASGIISLVGYAVFGG